jgi:hypothetical protein
MEAERAILYTLSDGKVREGMNDEQNRGRKTKMKDQRSTVAL